MGLGKKRQLSLEPVPYKLTSNSKLIIAGILAVLIFSSSLLGIMASFACAVEIDGNT